MCQCHACHSELQKKNHSKFTQAAEELTVETGLKKNRHYNYMHQKAIKESTLKEAHPLSITLIYLQQQRFSLFLKAIGDVGLFLQFGRNARKDKQFVS